MSKVDSAVAGVSKAADLLTALQPQIAAARIAISLGWTTYKVVHDHFSKTVNDEETLNQILSDLDRRIARRQHGESNDLPSAG